MNSKNIQYNTFYPKLLDCQKIAYNILGDEELAKKCSNKAIESTSHIKTSNMPVDYTVYQTAPTQKTTTLKKKRMKIAVLIASILLFIGICSVDYIFLTAPVEINDPDMALAVSVIDDGYVNTSKLRELITGYTHSESLYVTAFYCNYDQCSLDNEDFLKYCKGDLITELSTEIMDEIFYDIPDDFVLYDTAYTDTYKYYKLAGHDDIAHIIIEHNDDYYLLQYTYADNFNYTPYPYRYILEYVYGIDSADDITGLVITDYSNESAISKINEIDNRETIEYVYDVISGMYCYEPDNWSMIENVSSIPYNLIHTAYNMTIVTASGETIDLLQFDNVYKGFYDYFGTPFDELDIDTLEIFRNFTNSDTVTYTPTYLNWDVDINISDVTSTGLCIFVSQCGEDLADQLYLYDAFYIEMWDGYTWLTLDTTEDIGFDGVSELIPADYNITELVDINWEYIYGELPGGTYRICNYISCEDEYVTNPYDSYLYYTKFEIPE